MNLIQMKIQRRLVRKYLITIGHRAHHIRAYLGLHQKLKRRTNQAAFVLLLFYCFLIRGSAAASVHKIARFCHLHSLCRMKTFALLLEQTLLFEIFYGASILLAFLVLFLFERPGQIAVLLVVIKVQALLQ